MALYEFVGGPFDGGKLDIPPDYDFWDIQMMGTKDIGEVFEEMLFSLSNPTESVRQRPRARYAKRNGRYHFERVV